MEFFYRANSKAAPFFSDTSEGYVEAKNAIEAAHKVRKDYSHPCGLFALNIYENADAYHKGNEPVAIWRSPETEEQHAT